MEVVEQAVLIEQLRPAALGVEVEASARQVGACVRDLLLQRDRLVGARGEGEEVPRDASKAVGAECYQRVARELRARRRARG